MDTLHAEFLEFNETDRIIRGYVVAEVGTFKTRRGRFTTKSLEMIQRQINMDHTRGLKSRFAHPTLSNDGLGRYLGRTKNAVIDGGKLRADLHIADISTRSPEGNLGAYVMELAKLDPQAFGASLVLEPSPEFELDDKGKPITDSNGKTVPPIWFPKKLFACDVVDSGDATNSFLDSSSPFELPWNASFALDKLFQGMGRDEIDRRCREWLSKYLLRMLNV
jgi:hypothetical protein